MVRSLFIAASAERAEPFLTILRRHGYEPDLAATAPSEGGVEAYAIVFVELALGAARATEVTRALAAVRAVVPPLVAIVGEPAGDEVDELVNAGANMYFPDDPAKFEPRLRFLRGALAGRARFAALLEALRASEERTRAVIAAVDEGLIVQDTEGAVISYNPAVKRLCGLTDEDMRTRVWRGPTWQIFGRDGSPLRIDELPSARAARTGVAVPNEVVGGRRPDGTTVWISLNAQPMLGHDGAPIGVVTTLRDVTEARNIEERFRALLDIAPDGVVVHTKGTIKWVNRALLALLGFEEREMIGRDVLLCIAPRWRDELRRHLGTTDFAQPHEHALVRRDGTEVEVSVHAVPIVFDGEPARIAFIRDLTAHRKLETQLVAADRLANLGRVAAGVGHEINNPLTYVIGNVRSALDRLAGNEDLHEISEMLGDALEGAERVRCIVRDLKVFAARAPDRLGAVDVHKVVESAARMAMSEIRPRARFERELEPVPPVRGDEARLGQVLLNLLVNAAHAIAEGHPLANAITVSTRAEPDGRVVIRVRDTGVGIPPEHLGRIFEPFFTTKEERGGMGLGLSICQMLVTSFGGEIGIESDRTGTVVTVRLLAAEAPRAVTSPPARPTSVPPSTPRRVLVVDDEARIAQLIREGLAGHDVTVVNTGREALAQVAATPYDVIVCDLMMPEVSGIEVYERVRALRPGLEQRVVFITGGAFTERAIGFLSKIRNACLEKPFPLSELAAAIDVAARRAAPS